MPSQVKSQACSNSDLIASPLFRPVLLDVESRWTLPISNKFRIQLFITNFENFFQLEQKSTTSPCIVDMNGCTHHNTHAVACRSLHCQTPKIRSFHHERSKRYQWVGLAFHYFASPCRNPGITTFKYIYTCAAKLYTHIYTHTLHIGRSCHYFPSPSCTIQDVHS
jgi:hypothetical protein